MPLLTDEMADPDRPVTRRELRAELEDILRTLATKEDLKALRDELRTEFKVITETFKEHLGNLYDWTHANTDGLDRRLGDLDRGYGRRLLSVEMRVAMLEARRKPR